MGIIGTIIGTALGFLGCTKENDYNFAQPEFPIQVTGAYSGSDDNSASFGRYRQGTVSGAVLAEEKNCSDSDGEDTKKKNVFAELNNTRTYYDFKYDGFSLKTSDTEDIKANQTKEDSKIAIGVNLPLIESTDYSFVAGFDAFKNTGNISTTDSSATVNIETEGTGLGLNVMIMDKTNKLTARAGIESEKTDLETLVGGMRFADNYEDILNRFSVTGEFTLKNKSGGLVANTGIEYCNESGENAGNTNYISGWIIYFLNNDAAVSLCGTASSNSDPKGVAMISWGDLTRPKLIREGDKVDSIKDNLTARLPSYKGKPYSSALENLKLISDYNYGDDNGRCIHVILEGGEVPQLSVLGTRSSKNKVLIGQFSLDQDGVLTYSVGAGYKR